MVDSQFSIFRLALLASRKYRAPSPSGSAGEPANWVHAIVTSSSLLTELDRITSYNVCYTKLLRILAKALASETISPRYGVLRATTQEHYSGKSLSYRESHPRHFTCKPFKEEFVIVVDDIITTGITLLEATEVLLFV